MTQNNFFCREERCLENNNIRQEEYRVFNVKVTKEEYFQSFVGIYHKLELDPKEHSDTIFHTAFRKMRDTLSQEEKQKYYNIPHFNREGFTFITGIEKEEIEKIEYMEDVEKTIEREENILTIDGKRYKVTPI